MQELNDALCRDFADTVNKKSKSGPTITLALSGGNTPGMFFRQLASWNEENKTSRIDWSRIHFFWADERCVPPMHPESNFGMAHSSLLSSIELKPEQIHRIRGENNPASEVERYSDEIMDILPVMNGLPVFDQIFLGLGEDGHTASIFPGRPDLLQSGNICELVRHPVTGQHRISLTMKTINNARRIIFVVTGRAKSNVIAEIADHSSTSEQYPAYWVRPVHGTVEWYLDQQAARLIT
ncbi:MAG: 6-phosphogluconolactonase [Bacteroidales bacterium]|nr:6-phosphogluconolactonase [Bacteroidales bacterium]